MDLVKIPNQHNYIANTNIDSTEFKNWHFKDIINDSIPGISLDRAYGNLLKHKNGNEIIVAVIDMSVAINHEGLRQNIWENPYEIDNGLDDDNNGYIDDYYGWNFLGNKKGENTLFAHQETTRILKKHGVVLNFNTQKSISSSNDYLKKVFTKYSQMLESAKEDSIYISNVTKWKKEAFDYIKGYFDDEVFTINELDSLKILYPNDTILQREVIRASNFIKYAPDTYIQKHTLEANSRLSKVLNLKYNDRVIIDDNPNDLSDINYGNNKVDSDVALLDHGTKVAGIIGANYINNIGEQGFSKNIKLMPLCISPFGNEHDKDIALAIRYAVDNGAKVINMSIGKFFSLYPEWVFDALKYAETHNVLVVSGAGNSQLNLNEYNYYFPNDNLDNNLEVSDNFIKVGASTYQVNENIFANYSNYGNIDIDVFAPGQKIYTTSVKKEKYEFMNGSSASCAITTGVAALLFSYYPNLTASQVKHIILDSGVEYTFPVKVPIAGTKKDTLIPFNQLSKSGKIVNAYNALIMADSISKN